MSSETAREAATGATGVGLGARAHAADLVRVLADLVRLAKPRITALVVLTASAGYLAAPTGGTGLWGVLHLALGTALLAGGTNALNQLLERDADARMLRTRDRPLPAGRLSPAAAGAFGLLALGVGALHLLLQVNALTAGLGVASAVLYVAAYTPLKRRSSAALVVGAVPGALPVLGGWTAARGAVEPTGLALFGVLFLWQLPHFLALGWILRDDYRRAGFRITATGSEGGTRSRVWAVLAAVALVPVSLLPSLLGVAGWSYAAAAAGLGLFYLVRSSRFAAGSEVAVADGGGKAAAARPDERARRLFRASLWYLPALLAVLVVDATLLEVAAPGAESLPHLNAVLNATAAALLCAGFVLIRRGSVRLHRGAMLLAAASSAVFLTSYVVYHAAAGSVPFEGSGPVAWIYYGVLVTHAALAIPVLPLAVVTVVRGLADRREAHRGLARWTLPLWLYVSVSGIVVYLMLYGL